MALEGPVEEVESGVEYAVKGSGVGEVSGAHHIIRPVQRWVLNPQSVITLGYSPAFLSNCALSILYSQAKQAFFNQILPMNSTHLPT